MRPDLSSFPDQGTFLHADTEKAAALKSKYADQFGNAVRIGISWRSGNPRFGKAKSLSLTELGSVFTQVEATFVDLQYGDNKEERLALQSKADAELYRDPDIDSLADLDAFAAQVAAMDLIITASNTTAHMAGALGVPCWVMVLAGPGLLWYWFLDRNDSPWYPSLRLFRQTTPGDWTTVIQEVSEALTGFVSSRSGPS